MTDNMTGLFFHKGDSATLAMSICKIMGDDGLASNLSREARAFALSRYAKDSIVNGTLAAYKAILKQLPAGTAN